MLKARVSRVVSVLAVTGLASTVSYSFWTRRCLWPDIIPEADAVLNSTFFHKYNPLRNPVMIDVCVRELPISQLNHDLVQGTTEGGAKLVESFCGSLWAGSGYTLQRKLWERMFRSLPGRSQQLWDPPELLASKYEPGTCVTDHLLVISKTPTSILFRAGESPALATEDPRESESLFEVAAKPNFETGVVEFSIKSLMFQGWPKSKSTKQPLEGLPQWLHKRYTEILMETAIKLVQK